MGKNAQLATVTQGADPADFDGLARRGLLSLGGAAVSAAGSFLVILIIARGAGPQLAGNMFSATALFVIAESLCALGTATGLVYFIARVRALDRSDGVRGILRTALPPVAIVSALVGTMLYVLAPTVSGLIFDGPAEAMTGLLRGLAFFLPCAVLFDVLIAGTQGFHTMTPTVLLEKIGRPLLQIVLLVSAFLIGNEMLLPLAWAAPYAVGLALVALALARLVRNTPRPVRSGDRVVPTGEFWRYTGPRGIAAVAQLTLQRLDILLVAGFLGPREAAVYTAATRFVVLGQLGSQAIALAIQPKFSELLAKADLVTTQRIYQTSTAWVIAVTWPVHMLVAVLSPLILLLFGTGYAEGAPVVVVLAGAMLIATGCGMVTMLLVMAGRTRANLFNVSIALVVNLTLNLILIPRIGIIGAAIAWAAAIALSNLAPLLQIRVSLGLHPFGRQSAAVAVLATGTLALLPGLGWLLGGGGAAVGLAAAGVALYLVGLWKLRRLLQLDGLIEPIVRRLR